MRIFRITLTVLLSGVIIFTLLFGVGKIGEKPSPVIREGYKGILTLWHIDSFEGGQGSRKQFLLDTAVGFEKKNDGVLVMVVSYTAAGVKDNFEKGIFPDMLSFGNGVSVANAQPLSTKRTHISGMVNADAYFTPWCRGGYALIKNPKFSNEQTVSDLLVSQAEFTQPLTAFYGSGYIAKSVRVKKPMDAYIEFVSGKTPYFLGTQRDIHRLNSRGMEYELTCLEGYNDLFQYIAVTSTDTVKSVYSQSFVEYLMSDTVQKKLDRIGMFSVFTSVDYDNQNLCAMQNAEYKRTVSAFTSAEELRYLQSLSALAVTGDTEAQIKLKNIWL